MADAGAAPELLFATPLWVHELPGLVGIRKEAVEAILDLAAAHDTAQGRSVRGGWHSGRLFSQGAPAPVRRVLAACLAEARACLAPAYGDWAQHRLQLGSAWASVLGPDDYNSPHHHAPQPWSAVVWLQVPAVGPGRNRGQLELYHPAPSDDPWGRGSVMVSPKDNHMALFPGRLLHMVHPTATPVDGPEGLRIAIAFNANVRPAAPAP